MGTPKRQMHEAWRSGDIAGVLGCLPGTWSFDRGVAVRCDKQRDESYLSPFVNGSGSKQRARSQSAYEASYYDLSTYHAMLDSFLDLVPTHAVLGDIGCGDGRFTHYVLSKRADLFVFATDVNADNLTAIGASLNKSQAKRFLPGCVSIEQLEDCISLFDALLLLEVIYTLPSPAKGYRTMSDLLSPGGYALVSNVAKSAYFLHALLNSNWGQIGRILETGEYRDYVHGDPKFPFTAHLYDENLMRQHAEQAKLTVIKSATQNGSAGLMLHAMRQAPNTEELLSTHVELLKKANSSDLQLARLYIDLLRN